MKSALCSCLVSDIDRNTLDILLRDRSRAGVHNIIWATREYENLGRHFADEMKPFIELEGKGVGVLVMPRSLKEKKSREGRTRERAEVATPAWICDRQNNLVDDAWFGEKGVFSLPKEKGGSKDWKEKNGKISFSNGTTYIDYIKRNTLEVSCGEAPYLVTRYDNVTGKRIDVKHRTGLLDRKLRVVSENAETEDEWLSLAVSAFKSTFGFEWQGDSLFLARKNLLFSFIEHYLAKFEMSIAGFKKGFDRVLHEDLSEPKLFETKKRYSEKPVKRLATLRKIATIISYNIFQMDGEKCVIPESCESESRDENFLFGEGDVKLIECEGCKSGNVKKHNGVYACVMDWETGRLGRYVDML